MSFGVLQTESDSVSLRVPFTAPSAALVRRELRSWLQAQGYHGTVVDDARVIVSELVGNSVRHAHPLSKDDLLVSWWLEDDGLLLSVSDGGGGGSNGSAAAPRTMSASTSAVSGRGLSIVEALADRWWVEGGSGVSTVYVHMPL